MQLVLSVGNKVLALAPIDRNRLHDQEYLAAKKRLLKTIHQFSIAALKGEAVFYLQIRSKANAG